MAKRGAGITLAAYEHNTTFRAVTATFKIVSESTSDNGSGLCPLNASSCCVGFRDGKIGLKNPKPELLVGLLRESAGMINLPSGTCIWLIDRVSNMRKFFNDLGRWSSTFLMTIHSTSICSSFAGVAATRLKYIREDVDGLFLFIKRRVESQFLRPTARDGKVGISHLHLAMLLYKLDCRQPNKARFNSLKMF